MARHASPERQVGYRCHRGRAAIRGLSGEAGSRDGCRAGRSDGHGSMRSHPRLLRSSRVTVAVRSLTTEVTSSAPRRYLAPRGSGCPGLQFPDPGRDDPRGGAGGWCDARWRERVHAIVEPRSGLLRPGSAFPGLPEPPRGRRAPPRVPRCRARVTRLRSAVQGTAVPAPRRSPVGPPRPGLRRNSCWRLVWSAVVGRGCPPRHPAYRARGTASLAKLTRSYGREPAAADGVSQGRREG